MVVFSDKEPEPDENIKNIVRKERDKRISTTTPVDFICAMGVS